MAFIFGIVLALGALFLWLSGHWFGWVLAFMPAWWLFQISTGDPHDAMYLVVGRVALCAAVTGIPYLIVRGSRPY